eukprot:5970456-Prymnesium_polylepis.2
MASFTPVPHFCAFRSVSRASKKTLGNANCNWRYGDVKTQSLRLSTYIEHPGAASSWSCRVSSSLLHSRPDSSCSFVYIRKWFSKSLRHSALSGTRSKDCRQIT